jgi:hypothetical protein
MVAAQFGAGQVAYSILWFFLFFVEIWLMLSVFIDVFRSHDLRGWAKAAWIIFVLAVPLLGICTPPRGARAYPGRRPAVPATSAASSRTSTASPSCATAATSRPTSTGA